MRLVILHYHIFKNAGTTIENILDHSFGERFLRLDVPGLDMPIPNTQILETLAGNPSLAALSSHQIRHPLPQAPGILFFDICFLRDPLDRLRSTYDYYRLKPDPADPMSDLAQHCNLGEFMASMIRDFPLYSKNVQVNNLACFGDSDEPQEKDLELAIRRMRETSFLGVVDLFDDSVAAGEYALRRVFPELDSAIPAANVSRGLEGSLAGRTAQVQEACGEDIYRDLVRLNQLDFRLVEAARVEIRRRKTSGQKTRGQTERLPGFEDTAEESSVSPRISPRTILQRAREVLPSAARRHPVFDAAFYLERYPDVAAAGINPLAHYLSHGAAENRQPHPLFDPEHYRKSARLPPGSTDLLAHFLSHGRDAASPHPLFDCQAWLDAHPDTPASENPLAAYLKSGKSRLRPPLAFFNSAGDLDWIAESQQLPFLRALRADQLMAQLGLEGGF